MLARLADPALYAAAFAHVAAKERERDSDEAMLPGAPSMSGLSFERDELCERLAKLVPAGAYELSAVTPRRAVVEGKQRILYHSPPLDVVVMTALATALSEALDGGFSSCLYSYRKGRSAQQALRAIAGYIKAHRAARPDPRTRGLYVIRRDVKAYGDAIPSGPDARVWTMLREALRAADVSLDEHRWRWLVGAIRPAVQAVEGFELDGARGIPTGSPLQPLIGNLYLSELDRICERVEGAFYARFGDDIVFVHPDASVAASVGAQMDEHVASLGLSLSADKCSELYLTAAGRPSDSAPAFRATACFDYLGLRLDARGEIGLPAAKLTRLLRNVDARLDAVTRLCAGESLETRARVCCSVVNAALDPMHETAERAAQLVRHAVTDRGQLRDLDYKLAMRVAEHVAGKRGVRAFRALPMRALKQRYGLASLVVERNRVEHARRSG